MSGSSPGPVFVGGVERSGTTLLGSLLGRHPRTVCVPQAPFKNRVQKRIVHAGSIPRSTLVAELEKYFRFRLWGVPVEEVRRALPDTVTDGRWFRILCDLYADRTGTPADPSSRGRIPVDHTPSNMRRARLLAESFPGARFLHIVRDGRGVAHSVLPLDWGPRTILDAPYYWGRKLSCGLMAERDLGEARIRRVRFEDLVSDPVSELRSIGDYLGLDFPEEALSEPGFSVPEYTRRQHRRVEEEVDPGRADAWKKGLTRRERELFEYYGEPWLDHLGYPLHFQPYPTRPTRRERWRYFWVDLMRIPLDKIRYRLRRLRS